jgi:rhamnose transport system permease protein
VDRLLALRVTRTLKQRSLESAAHREAAPEKKEGRS